DPTRHAEKTTKTIETAGATFAIRSNQKLAAKLSVKKVPLIDDEVARLVSRGPTHVAEIAARLSRVQPDDLCTIVYTSGTTGDPKGVELAHRNLVDISEAAVKVHPITDADSALSFLPYAHVLARITDIFVGIVYG